MTGRIDINCWIGADPWRDIGTTANELVRQLARFEIDRAWIANLSAAYWRDPMRGNAALFDAARSHPELQPIPAIHPELPGWITVLDDAVAHRVHAVRADPMQYAVEPAGAAMQSLVAACAARRIPLVLNVRLEDLRQRHPNDRAGDLPSWAVRQLLRSHAGARLLVTNADRDFIEQVHFGATPAEAARILWDIAWIWGPPEDHLELLIGTVGRERFTFGTAQPLRLPEAAIAKLDLLPDAPGVRAAIESGNLVRFLEATS